MPQIKKQPKKAKETDDMAEKLEQAVAFILDKLESLKERVDKIAGRMGI